MISPVLAASTFGSAATISEQRTGYTGSCLLLQHCSTLRRPEQPRFGHLLHHLIGPAANRDRCPAGSHCSPVRGAFLLLWTGAEPKEKKKSTSASVERGLTPQINSTATFLSSLHNMPAASFEGTSRETRRREIGRLLAPT